MEGGYSGSQDNHYQVFSAGGMDFLVLYFEYDEKPNTKVVAWADALLKRYANRRAIIVSHSLLELDGSFTSQGQAIYDGLKNNPNLFLLLCGHNPGESRRADIFNGQTVYTLLADFQNFQPMAAMAGCAGWSFPGQQSHPREDLFPNP